MKLLDTIKNKLQYLGTCSGAYILAHAAWSACDHRKIAGPSLLEISIGLDASNVELITQLQQITTQPDYNNSEQFKMLEWLEKNGYSDYIAKQVKISKKKFVNWM